VNFINFVTFLFGTNRYLGRRVQQPSTGFQGYEETVDAGPGSSWQQESADQEVTADLDGFGVAPNSMYVPWSTFEYVLICM
jgi:hypothetical protein